MKRIIYLFLIIISFLSCSDETKIKNHLKEELALECPNYQLIKLDISDTVYKSILEDSLVNLHEEISSNKILIGRDSSQLLILNKQLGDCKVQYKNTLYFLRSSWRGIISDYEKMIEDCQSRIQNKQMIIDNKQILIAEVDSLISNAPDSIVYFIIDHLYACGGDEINEHVFINTNLEIYKIEPNEN